MKLPLRLLHGMTLALCTQQIKDMIQSYIKKKQTIILAVVPANVDIETTEALKMAKEVDPTGERTLGDDSYVTLCL